MTTIHKSFALPFSPSLAFAAWTSSSTVISPAHHMNVEPYVGGRYQLFMDADPNGPRNEGTFSRVDPNKRLTYTWEWNSDGAISTIDVIFAATDTGCEITLSHGPFSSPDSHAMHDAGWDSYIAGLIAHLQET
jgi:uncharacterized protein YndB with AHSA1/START domain